MSASSSAGEPGIAVHRLRPEGLDRTYSTDAPSIHRPVGSCWVTPTASNAPPSPIISYWPPAPFQRGRGQREGLAVTLPVPFRLSPLAYEHERMTHRADRDVHAAVNRPPFGIERPVSRVLSWRFPPTCPRVGHPSCRPWPAVAKSKSYVRSSASYPSRSKPSQFWLRPPLVPWVRTPSNRVPARWVAVVQFTR